MSQPMSDNNRRLICRLVFIGLCALPSFGIAYWILHRPGIQDWQNALQASLGIEIEIDSLETPWPGQTVLRGVCIKQPYSETEYQINEILIHAGSVNRVYVNDSLSIVPADLMELIQQTSQHTFQLGTVSTRWQINFQTLAIDPNPESTDLGLMLSPVEIEVEQDLKGMTATARFQLSQLESGESMECKIFQPNDHSILKQEISLNTGTNSLPCWLGKNMVRDLAHMGDLSTFRGMTSLLIDNENRISGSVEGVFENINLQNLGEPVHQRLSGMATATIIDCEIVEDRIRRLHTKVHCNDGGWISPQVLISAQHHLNLQQIEPRSPNQFIEYGSFGFECLLDPPNDQFLVVDLDENGVLFDRNKLPLMRCSYVEAGDQMQAYPLRVIDLANFWIRPSALPNHQIAGNSREGRLPNHRLVEFLNRLDRQETRTSSGERATGHY